MKDDATNSPGQDLRDMSAHDLALWGLQDVAYVKRVMEDGEEGWAIYAADGTHMGMAPERELAFAAIKQHDLEPLSVH
ncbi:DUF1150 family protein [Telmatospirillum sp. J64-1]|uniref:DUF1150 family protein n=1 Tax=Telmatospirillum sp. J64-1 TaxID=2502183 RepID=UPI00115D5D55|nr:DUF1150 family protein [Telmatospirillum sp. J64-1]